eukprot:3296111-Rhodomonas_salina.1
MPTPSWGVTYPPSGAAIRMPGPVACAHPRAAAGVFVPRVRLGCVPRPSGRRARRGASRERRAGDMPSAAISRGATSHAPGRTWTCIRGSPSPPK